MTNEERDIITRFIERVGGATTGANGSPLPAVDPTADGLIGDLLARYPGARYRITQLAFVQEHALAEAQNRINRLQHELAQAQPQTPGPSPWQQPGAAAAAPASRGFFGSLFGGGQTPPPQAPQPQQYQAPPPYQPPPPQYAPQQGMFQQRGSGFLGSALTTAAGVAGGMVAGNALMNLFEGGRGGGLGGFGGGGGMGGGPETVVYENVSNVSAPAPESSPWSDAPPPPPGTGDGWGGTPNVDTSAWNTPDPAPFDQAQDSGGGWDSGSDSGGFDDNTA